MRRKDEHKTMYFIYIYEIGLTRFNTLECGVWMCGGGGNEERMLK